MQAAGSEIACRSSEMARQFSEMACQSSEMIQRTSEMAKRKPGGTIVTQTVSLRRSASIGKVAKYKAANRDAN